MATHKGSLCRDRHIDSNGVDGVSIGDRVPYKGVGKLGLRSLNRGWDPVFEIHFSYSS